MINTAVISVLTPRDRAKIQAIVAASPDSPFSFHLFKLNQAFKNVTPNHIICLGFMIGYQAGAVNTYLEIQNNNQPCQRAN